VGFHLLFAGEQQIASEVLTPELSRRLTIIVVIIGFTVIPLKNRPFDGFASGLSCRSKTTDNQLKG
jgi:hypothetical protein